MDVVGGLSHGDCPQLFVWVADPVLGYVMSCLGCFLGLRCTTRAREVQGSSRVRWLLLAGVSIGVAGSGACTSLPCSGSASRAKPSGTACRSRSSSMLIGQLDRVPLRLDPFCRHGRPWLADRDDRPRRHCDARGRGLGDADRSPRPFPFVGMDTMADGTTRIFGSYVLVRREGAQEVLRDHWVLLEGNRIADVTASRPAGADRVYDRPGRFVLPGLLNLHNHCFSEAVARAHTEDGSGRKNNQSIVYTVLLPLTKRGIEILTPTERLDIARLGILQLLKGGCATVMEPFRNGIPKCSTRRWRWGFASTARLICSRPPTPEPTPSASRHTPRPRLAERMARSISSDLPRPGRGAAMGASVWR